MPRFFFDIDDGRELVSDADGAELIDECAAETEARQAIGEIAHDLLARAGGNLKLKIIVRGEDGNEPFVVVLAAKVLRRP
jgi:hypothetical protein